MVGRVNVVSKEVAMESGLALNVAAVSIVSNSNPMESPGYLIPLNPWT